LTGATGSRDPYEVIGHGAGFVICWSGNPRLKLGYDNPEKQFLQVESKEMIFAIPEYVNLWERTALLLKQPKQLAVSRSKNIA
jgi:hypothetical protein